MAKKNKKHNKVHYSKKAIKAANSTNNDTNNSNNGKKKVSIDVNDKSSSKSFSELAASVITSDSVSSANSNSFNTHMADNKASKDTALITIRTHRYAENAYPMVEKIQGTKIEAEYRTLALTFPTMIMQSGLAQAIGFLMAKGKEHHEAMLSHVASLLGKSDGQTLHNEILKSSVTEYQLMTRQALQATSWLKRYTQALLVKEKSSVVTNQSSEKEVL